MNIFYLDNDTKVCATSYYDKHVVKMILESAQMLCTSINLASGRQLTPYKSTHANHPSRVWVGKSRLNALWLLDLVKELNNEYKFRYSKATDHLSYTKLIECGMERLITTYLPDLEFSEPPLAMPDEYKIGNAIDSYRLYYKVGKIHLKSFTKRTNPNLI